MGLLDDWNLSYADVNELVTDNPSLRGMVFGYAAEVKARKLWFEDHNDVTSLYKARDHDRTEKGDIFFDYKGHRIAVEVKSLQSSTVRTLPDGSLTARFQCDASDRRTVEFLDGSSIETTLLLVGEFDLLAVNLFKFTGEWTFAFAKNSDLPRCTIRSAKSNGYTEYQRQRLLASLMPISWPLNAPYCGEPFELLDEVVTERQQGTEPDLDDVEIRESPKRRKN